VSDCVKFRELLEAYALGALDVPERAALEAHLATGCTDCAKALAEAHWLVNQLAYLAPEALPSAMLKVRLLQTVRAEAQAAKQSASPKSAIPFWIWAGVAALLVVTIYSAWNAQRLQHDIQATNQKATAILQQRRDLEAQLEAAKREATIVTDPASVKIALAAQKTPVPSSDRVLQLWLIPKAPGGKPIPSLTVRPDADGKFVLLVAHPPELMVQTKALAITEEPEGGSPQPTTAPRWVGGVS
jgi:anti-sigma-K factor RskA